MTGIFKNFERIVEEKFMYILSLSMRRFGRDSHIKFSIATELRDGMV